jgi:hypothetical protein
MSKSQKRQKWVLPDKIIPIKNDDKEFHESWTPNRNMLNICHPFRAVILGTPNCGKSTTAKNLIIRQDPPFEEVFIIHCDYENTKEYDDIGAQMLGEIPAPEEWEGQKKTLVILDDLEYKQMSKIQKKNLDRLFGYVSTHKNISVILCAQDPFNVPPCVRRMSNLWILWKINDTDSLNTCARKAGLKKNEMNDIFSMFTDPRDSLWIDMTSQSPWPMRKNGFIPIIKEDDK